MAAKHAIVMGGSMAGLLAARVLSEYFEQVTLLERDVPVDAPEARKVSHRAGTLTYCWRAASRFSRGCFPGSLRIW